MKIVHIINIDYATSNGIKTALSYLIPEQEILGHNVLVLNKHVNSHPMFRNEMHVQNVYALRTIVLDYVPDIVLFHGSYELHFYLYAFLLQWMGVAYLVVPHGGTSKFNLQKRRRLKSVVNLLLTKPFMKHSSGIVFLNKQERDNSIFINIINNYCYIPNGVEVRSIDITDKTEKKKVSFIFLSRIDIKFKGIDVLLKAIEIVSNTYSEMEFDFHFYGSSYDNSITQSFEELITKTRGPIFYHGAVFGMEKDKAYRNANIYVLPSLSEGMPLSVLEALSYGNPCIVSPQTNMASLILETQSGWVTETNPKSIASTLYLAYTKYNENREYYVNNALNAVKRYDWKNISKHSIREYAKLTGKTEIMKIFGSNNGEKLNQLMRPNIRNTWGIKELQNCILNIAQYIHKFCEENEIQYCIMGGTALGAVRHGGFIPWDDDIDLFMTPNEYLKFRKAFIEKGDKENYYLQELGESNGKVVYAKLRLNNSTFIEEAVSDYDIHHGVFVDIMIQHVFPDNWFAQRWMILWQSYLELKSLANRKYMKRGYLFYYALKPLSWLPKRFLLEFALKQIWRYKDQITKNFFHYYIGYPLKKSIYPRGIFSEYELIDFETISLQAPIGIKEYLFIMFGDYMNPPNLNEIRWCQHTHNWSADTPFVKKGKGIYEAERYLW